MLGGLYALNTIKEPVNAAFSDIVEQMNSLWGEEAIPGELDTDDFDSNAPFDASSIDEVFGHSNIDFDISSEDLLII